MRQLNAKNLGSYHTSHYLNLGTTTILWPSIHILEHAILGVDSYLNLGTTIRSHCARGIR